MQVPKRRSEQNKQLQKDDGPVYLTSEGIKKLKRQLIRIERDLPRAITEVERTKEFGDFSENAEYKEAKYKLRRMNSKIVSIKARLARAILIDPTQNTTGKVQIGSTVTLEINEKQKAYQILGTHESDPTKGRISYQSPLGTALMGRAVGDVVTIDINDKPIKYKIVGIQ